MTLTNLTEAVKELHRPYTPAAVRIKPQTVTKAEPRKGLVTFYIDSRLVVARLNHVVGAGSWSDEFKLLSDDPKTGLPVECRLTVLGVTKCDVGQIEPGAFDNKAFKSAYSDALKRAAVKFGVGAYLYNLPQVWAPVSVGQTGKVRGFTDEGRAQAMKAYAGWISSDLNTYGEALDHGDVEHRVGDSDEEAAGDEPAVGLNTPALLDIAPRGDGKWAQVAEMQKKIEPTLDWKAASHDLMRQRFGVSDRTSLDEHEWEDFAIRWINAVAEMAAQMEGDFPPVGGEEIQRTFAAWFDGVMPPLTFDRGGASDDPEHAAAADRASGE